MLLGNGHIILLSPQSTSRSATCLWEALDLDRQFLSRFCFHPKVHQLAIVVHEPQPPASGHYPRFSIPPILFLVSHCSLYPTTPKS